MRLLRNTKRGSYIVEAVIIVPIFIMAVLMLISIVPIISTCENTVFGAADEMRLECAKSAFRKNAVVLPVQTTHRIYSENEKLDGFDVTSYMYRYGRNGIDDLITLGYSTTFSEKNPLGLFSEVNFDMKVTARAFTGKLQKDPPAPRGEFEEEKESRLVYVFPEWGKRYHGESCTYVKSACRLTYLSQDLGKKYSPCKLCDAASAPVGTPVFYFSNSGEVYHVSGCRTVDKYYTEMELEEAESKGYTPCSKCGGK